MHISSFLQETITSVFADLFEITLSPNLVGVDVTKKEFEGDYTLVTFPLVKLSKKSPEITATMIGDALVASYPAIAKYNVVKGFLNLTMSDGYWVSQLMVVAQEDFQKFPDNGRKVLVEYGSPNTNKPLHIGHVRNMLLGYSMTEILRANGYEVTTVSIYNDRGIAICKSMAAYLSVGKGSTPESTGIKGDHLVGDYYVRYGQLVDAELRAKYQVSAEANVYQTMGKEKEVAEQETAIFLSARDLLLKWEAGDEDTLALWRLMNSWVYAGYQVTFDIMGVSFDKDYYESDTYKLGKHIIDEGLEKGVYHRREDGAVAIDLTPDGLDEKILLRRDGTSLYMTQDLGTADVRYQEYEMEKMIYVVANEQDYHFKVLKLCLQKLGKSWADGIHHLSYGMVESPTGRFKSREGKTADADDLIAEVLRIAEEKTRELGKIESFTDDEARALFHTLGLGALKFYILRVDPYKKIVFNPEESIDFHGQTGPFVQYSYARIQSIIRRYASTEMSVNTATAIQPCERELIMLLCDYPLTISRAADNYDPSQLANYLYLLAKTYNKFYNEVPILTAATDSEKQLRILLSKTTGDTIRKGMMLLGMAVPNRM
jgi:arginyl-tRNA synthetase